MDPKNALNWRSRHRIPDSPLAPYFFVENRPYYTRTTSYCNSLNTPEHLMMCYDIIFVMHQYDRKAITHNYALKRKAIEQKYDDISIVRAMAYYFLMVGLIIALAIVLSYIF